VRNVRIEVAYDGSRFYGWQRQDGFGSVQEALEVALEGLLGEIVTVHGSGRTDTGVHALRQVASFHVDTPLVDDRLRHALNAHLEDGVVVRRLETCDDEFHPRFDAIGKRYLYLTLTTRFRPPFAQRFAHWTNQPLDAVAMQRAARAIVGEHDFRAFSSTGSERKTTVRTVRDVKLVKRRERFAIVVEANGFLYNMVRIIAGSLIDIGRGRLDAGCVERALASGDREELGATAPPDGLYLLRVRYRDRPFRGADRGQKGVPGLFQS
jgi:tRNA pseudouridine38-40 synthase